MNNWNKNRIYFKYFFNQCYFSTESCRLVALTITLWWDMILPFLHVFFFTIALKIILGCDQSMDGEETYTVHKILNPDQEVDPACTFKL